MPSLTDEPVPLRRRFNSPEQETILREQVTRWHSKGIIERANGLPWVNNTVFAAKKNGQIRTCIDCTPANKVTEDFDWPLPKLQDLRHAAKGAQWFSRLDLRDAFFRISVPAKWRRLTAFSAGGQDWQFVRMPFGLKTAPAVFQRFMDHHLRDFISFLFWYIDDVLVFADTKEELRRRTVIAKQRLRQIGCEVNEEKSEYESKGLLFAGIWINGNGIGPNAGKLRQVLSLPPPRTKVEKQSALGLVSYLRDHIPLASLLTASLSTGKANDISDDEYAKEWNHLLKHIARNVTTLTHWSQDEDADLYTDASNQGAAAVLMQKGRIVMVASRKLTPAETRYSATDREALGLLLAADKFRLMLHRPRGVTQVWSDHSALLGRKLQDMTPRQYRWHMKITQWITNLKHVKGKDNPADYFSRWAVAGLGGQIRV